MPEKHKQSSTELRHFIRANSQARNREIVVEKVAVGSASFKFLQRMEERRKKQECVRTIDLRGRVEHECKSYIYKNHVFWMDDISNAIFQEGLKANGNVFTNEIFEKIINNNKAPVQVKKLRQDNIQTQDSASVQASELDKIERQFKIEGNDAILLEMGYFQKRQYPRFKQSTALMLNKDSIAIEARTRDISSQGLNIVYKTAVDLKSGDEIFITFSGFNKDKDCSLTDIKYTVLDLTYREPDFVLSVTLTEENEKVSNFIEQFISDQLKNIRGRRKLDIDDIRMTSESLMMENYYSISTPCVPFFISKNNSGLELSSICMNSNNKQHLQCFRDKNNVFDFTNLSDVKRINELRKKSINEEGCQILMAVFTDKYGSVKVLFNYDFDDHESWNIFLSDKSKHGKVSVLMLQLTEFDYPSDTKIKNKIAKLSNVSDESVRDIEKFIHSVVVSGVIVDVTEEIIDGIVVNKKGNELKLLNDALAQVHKKQSSKGNDVDLLQFGYVEQRREDRYIVSVDVEINHDGKRYVGVTHDLSIKGLCVNLEGITQHSLRKGDELRVDFPVLHKRAQGGVQLINIPYTVTCLHAEDGHPVLHLLREKTKHWKNQSAFFKDIIDRNIKLVKLDTRDIETSTKSRLIASMTAQNVMTLPIVIQRESDGNGKVVNIAMSEKSGSMAEFFEVEAGKYDFKSLTQSSRLARITSGLNKKSTCSQIVYLYKKQVPGIAKFYIYSATENDFQTEKDRKVFFESCSENEYRVLKIMMSNVIAPQEIDINSSMGYLQEMSPQVGQRIANQYNNTLAVGDIIDITAHINLPDYSS